MSRHVGTHITPTLISNKLFQLSRFYFVHKPYLNAKETKIFKRYFMIQIFIIIAIAVMIIISIRNFLG